MKLCPKCGQSYSDDNSFCFDDGTALVLASTGAPAFTQNDVPTQVIPRSSAAPQRSGGSPWLYALVGMLATVIVVMGLFIWWSSGDKLENKQSIANATPTPERASATASPTPSATTATSPVPSPSPTVDAEQIRSAISDRLAKWERDGEARDGNAVVTNYADTVAYYRRTVGRDYILADKSRAYSKYSSIEIVLDNISITPSADGRTARVVLDKAYTFTGNGMLQGKVKQELKLIRVGGEWLINGERDLSVYYQTK